MASILVHRRSCVGDHPVGRVDHPPRARTSRRATPLIVELPKPDEPAPAGTPGPPVAPPPPAARPSPPPSAPKPAPTPPAVQRGPSRRREERRRRAPRRGRRRRRRRLRGRPSRQPSVPRRQSPRPAPAEPAPKVAEPPPSPAEKAPARAAGGSRSPARRPAEQQVARRPARRAGAGSARRPTCDGPASGRRRDGYRGAAGSRASRFRSTRTIPATTTISSRYAGGSRRSGAIPASRAARRASASTRKPRWMIEFGILKDGRVQFVDVVHAVGATRSTTSTRPTRSSWPRHFRRVPSVHAELGEAGQHRGADPGALQLLHRQVLAHQPASLTHETAATPGRWLDTAIDRCVA